jgi:hypothetical protein
LLLKLSFQEITHPDDHAADIVQAERVSSVRDKDQKLRCFITVVEDIT